MQFKDAVTWVLLQEGGYSNDSNDPGGETNFGISKKSYPHLDIRNLTRDQAIEIYLNDFWNKCDCENLPDCLKLSVFDMSVNQGALQAIHCLQRTVKVIQDGVIGVETINAVNATDEKELIENFVAERIMLYTDNGFTFHIYGRGWIRRSIRAMG